MLYSLSEATLRPSPIFDTNVFGDVQRGRISKTDWNYALRRRPGHGWPLSNVTALELLVAVDAAPQIESNPSGADIDIDGDFVGNTPSEIQISQGDHIVSVKKVGFKGWERNVKVNGGSKVHLTAELEPSQAQ